ncbi:hypothetical protein VTJ83DRAFT_4083 [Remersonia thermophila]|uniref:Vacuolar protein sorting-associated protein TDA6 n=1 Tax=Remersonia thermophila TaxID=72144 RepID=A0ABR4DI31_9PEZI
MAFRVLNRRRVAIASSLSTAFLLLVTFLPQYLNPTPPDHEERERDKHWVSTSPSWLDRQACRWLGVCGLLHIRWDAPTLADSNEPSTLDELKSLALTLSTSWTYGEKEGVSGWEVAPTGELENDVQSHTPRAARIHDDNVPQYVLDHAPLVHLYSGEHFWPSDIAEHLRHMLPFVNGTELNWTHPVNPDTLGTFNAVGDDVFLTSEADVESRPLWLHSRDGIPTPFEDDDQGSQPDDPSQPPDDDHDDGDESWQDLTPKRPPHRIAPPREALQRHVSLRRRQLLSKEQRPLVGHPPGDKQDPTASPGYSRAPAILILVDKGAGILDAFWFFFYSYNLGQTVLKIRFGNHVGDWEHCMVRFQHGVPRAMFLSEHAGGKAYLWKALEKRHQKDDKPPRPVIYSAVGSHAMYATPGMHPYVLPFKLLKDVTDRGPLWDPALNNYAYWYDPELDREERANGTEAPTSLRPAACNPDLPTSWFHFEGYWGDDIYPLSDQRQWRLFGEYHYITGPRGPKDKFLERRRVCQTEKCTIVDSIEAGKKLSWY